MKKIVIFNIYWDASDEELREIDLPRLVALDEGTTKLDDSYLANYLRDKYGYDVKKFEVEVVDVTKERRCGNCKHRAYSSWSGIDYCMWYEIATTEGDEMVEAAMCGRYEKGTPDCYADDEYCPSATGGDYSPSSPWNAPGMSVRDFI